METIQVDVAIIGAGGAVYVPPLLLCKQMKLRIALIAKVYPMRSHTCAAEGGAAGVIKAHDSFEQHFHDTVGGGDWLSDQDAVEYFIDEAPKEAPTRTLGLLPLACCEADGSVAVRPFGGMKIQRTWFVRQIRFPYSSHSISMFFIVSQHSTL